MTDRDVLNHPRVWHIRGLQQLESSRLPPSRSSVLCSCQTEEKPVLSLYSPQDAIPRHLLCLIVHGKLHRLRDHDRGKERERERDREREYNRNRVDTR